MFFVRVGALLVAGRIQKQRSSRPAERSCPVAAAIAVVGEENTAGAPSARCKIGVSDSTAPNKTRRADILGQFHDRRADDRNHGGPVEHAAGGGVRPPCQHGFRSLQSVKPPSPVALSSTASLAAPLMGGEDACRFSGLYPRRSYSFVVLGMRYAAAIRGAPAGPPDRDNQRGPNAPPVLGSGLLADMDPPAFLTAGRGAYGRTCGNERHAICRTRSTRARPLCRARR